MKVPWPDEAIHKRLTEHRQQAYEEKPERRHRAGPIRTNDWDAEIESAYRKLQEPERGESSSKLRMRRSIQASTPGSFSGAPAQLTPSRLREGTSPTLTVASRDLSVSATLPSNRHRGRPQIGSPSTSSPRSSATASSSAILRKGRKALTPVLLGLPGSLKLHRLYSCRYLSTDIVIILLARVVFNLTLRVRRGRISSAWNKAAREAGAAMVRICPDIVTRTSHVTCASFDTWKKVTFSGMSISYRCTAVFRSCSHHELEVIFKASRGVFTMCDCMTCSSDSACSCRDLSNFLT
jgi:[histone H3]-lysine9 N-trimethyltransferase SUV39H